MGNPMPERTSGPAFLRKPKRNVCRLAAMTRPLRCVLRRRSTALPGARGVATPVCRQCSSGQRPRPRDPLRHGGTGSRSRATPGPAAHQRHGPSSRLRSASVASPRRGASVHPGALPGRRESPRRSTGALSRRRPGLSPARGCVSPRSRRRLYQPPCRVTTASRRKTFRNPRRHRVRGACHYPLRGSDRRENRRNPARQSPCPSLLPRRRATPPIASLMPRCRGRTPHGSVLPPARRRRPTGAPSFDVPSRSAYTDRRTSVPSLDVKAAAVVIATTSFAAARTRGATGRRQGVGLGNLQLSGRQFFERTPTFTALRDARRLLGQRRARTQPRAGQVSARFAGLRGMQAIRPNGSLTEIRHAGSPFGRTTGDEIAEPTYSIQRSLSAHCGDRRSSAVNLTGHHPTTRA